MAPDASGWRPRELASGMAGGAVQCGMRSRQGEAGQLQVVKLGAQPGVGAVALLARGGETAGYVIGASGLLVIVRVARVTLGWQSLELPRCGILVAGSTVQRGVRADQRKTILVLVDLLHRDLPALHRVALFARGAELTLVDVGVAVCALCADVGENWFDVTLSTSHPFMHAA